MTTALMHFDPRKQAELEFGTMEPDYGFARFPKAKGIVSKTQALFIWQDVWDQLPSNGDMELIFEHGAGAYRLRYESAKKYATFATTSKRYWWPLHMADRLDSRGEVIIPGKLVASLNDIPNTGCPILTLGHLNEVVDRFMGFKSFVFDVETLGRDGHDGLHFQTNEVFWVSLAGPGEAWSIPCGHPTGPKQLTVRQVFDALEPLFFNPDIRKVNQNIKFDLLTVAKYYGGQFPVGPYGDTLVAAHLLNENMKDKALDKLTQKYLGFSYEKLGRKGVENYTFKQAALYSYLDAKCTWLLWRDFVPMINDQRLTRVMHLEMDILRVLLDMETEGALIDEKAIHVLDERLRYDLEILQSDLDQYNGGPFRLTVPREKIDFVYKKRGHPVQKTTAKKGEPSTDAEALSAFTDDPAIQCMLDFADVSKLHSTYVAGFIPKIYKGRLHANYKQAGTVTGRFSCSEPNLQNIPRPDDDHAERGMLIRSLFIAPEGHKLGVGDYAQIEMRVIAHYSQDPRLIKNFLAGIDFHTTTAASILGKPIDKVTKTDRQVGKGIAFAVAFGAGPDKVARVAGVSTPRAEGFLKKHRKEFPNIYTMQADIIRSCKSSRPPHVTTILGRRRRLPQIFANDYSVAGKAERQAINTVIQGSAADIIKLAMVRLHSAIEGTPFKLILSVHDELGVVAPEDRADEAVLLMREAMEGIDLLRIPPVADIKVVDSWDQAK